MKRVIKKIIEKILYAFCSKKEKDLYKIIDEYNYVSFDIFDTLIKRNVKDPTDIFDIVEMEYNKQHADINNFKKDRIKAERKAHEKSNYEDVTLDEIYEKLKGYNKEEKERLKRLEIQVEKDLCVVNQPMYVIYKYCLFSNKKIFFTSDMYLEKDLVNDLLNKLGYKHYERIYLSSNDRLRKRTGNLFKKLLKDENIKKDKIIHIGDSVTGDFLIPRKLGIKTILIKRENKNSMFSSTKNKSLEYNMLSSFINNNISSLNEYEHFGYEVLGPILYSFTTWVHKKVKEDKVDKLYFLARDAKIIMEVYKERFGEDIPIYYLEISRKSIVKASLYNLNDWDDLIYKTKSLVFTDVSCVKDLLNALEINKDIPCQNKQISELTDEEKEKTFNLIKDDIETNSKIQNDNLKLYLKQNDFTGNLGIVDIGWNGTIQYYLEKYIDKKTKLFGYYYGINNAKKFDEYSSINRNGYLFNSNELSNFQSVIRLSAAIFEIMFLTPTPSTIGYKKVGKVIKSVYGKKENHESKSIKSIQEFAKKFACDVKDSNVEKYICLFSKETFFYNYQSFATKPTFKQINMFKKLDFSNVGSSKLIEHKSLIFYIFHPKQFYIDLRSSDCHVMFMKSIFKINLPYYKILKKVYESGVK